MRAAMSCFAILLTAVACIPSVTGEPFFHVNPIRSNHGPSSSSADDDVLFYLYTQTNPTAGMKIIIGDETSLTDYRPGAQTKIVVHGFFSGPGTMAYIKDEFLKYSNINVIMMDWSKLAISLEAMANTIPAGQTLATLIDFLVKVGTTVSDIELIGFSLGGHVVGIGANRTTAGKIGRITGLDPVGTGFGNVALENRLDASDGDFVKIVHTSTLGWSTHLGHSDFFVNGGTYQPECLLDITGICSHFRSITIYGNSIGNASLYVGTLCSDWATFTSGQCADNPTAPMGPTTPTSTRGDYFLSTTAKGARYQH